MGEHFNLFWADSGAQLSSDLMYRYILVRKWGPGIRRLLWVMLNPSTADGRENDPTLRKCIGFSKRWGYNSLVVVNLYAFRATDPRDLVRAVRNGLDVIGPERDAWIRGAWTVGPPTDVCVAWGAHPEAIGVAADLLHGDALPRRLLCVARTASGAPRHPLMAAYTAVPEVFRA